MLRISQNFKWKSCFNLISAFKTKNAKFCKCIILLLIKKQIISFIFRNYCYFKHKTVEAVRKTSFEYLFIKNIHMRENNYHIYTFP